MKIFFTLISLCSVINLVLSQYNFEVYEFNYNRNPIVYNRNNGYNINLYNQNPFLSSTSNYVPQQSNINYQSGTVSVTSSGSCANYFSYVSENNQIIGHISMTSSDVNRNVINITLSVAAHLPSVSFVINRYLCCTCNFLKVVTEKVSVGNLKGFAISLSKNHQ